MKNIVKLAVLSCLLLQAPQASTQSQDIAAQAGASVSGDVVLAESGSGHDLRDASHVVVWLTTIDPIQRERSAIPSQHFRMVQRNKRFEPQLLVVPIGSVVDFPNADPWFHNVFSLYRGKRFDLGLYQAGSQKSIRFDRPGPSYLFCNIHPEMTGVILAVDSSLFATSDKTGHFSISGVPPGRYLIHVWHENASPENLQSLQKVIAIDSGNRTLSAITIPVTKQMHAEHKNKYGEEYDPGGMKTDY
jgi:plastocyanin